MDGKIINFDFETKERVKKDVPAGCEVGDYPRARLLIFISSFKRAGFSTKLMNLKASAMSLATDQGIIGAWSTDQLMNQLRDSNEHDWVTKPAFFQTIYSELIKRAISGKDIGV